MAARPEITPAGPELARLRELGFELLARGDLGSASSCFERCLDLDPSSFELQLALGKTLAQLGAAEAAVGHFQCALAIDPRSVEACWRLAEVLHRLNRPSGAGLMARRIVALEPGLAAGHTLCGNLEFEARRFDEAIECYLRALALDPQSAEAHCQLGHAQFRLGRIEEALASYRRAVAANPADPAPHSALVYAAGFHPSWGQERVLAEARAWCERHAEPLRLQQRPHPHDRAPGRRLRLGYVSPNFDTHCQRFFTLPLLRHHDRDRFEVCCYSGVERPDEWTSSVRSHVDLWRDVHALDDAALTELIREDRVDVLVDLTMHMSGGRLRVFAAKPAPVQLCWLAYPGTTGLAAMDFRITDPYLDPPGSDPSLYSERSLHLPETFWCYDPLADGPQVSSLPALTEGRVTFGCLNDFCKVQPAVLELWARVLVLAPGSRLLLLAPLGDARRSVLQLLERNGVERERVLFIDRLPRADYLAMYQRIDVMLDCHPVNGHTTSLDALWMGVPVVTLVGHTILGRAGVCQARHVGLSDLVAESPDQFVQIALELSQDTHRLSELRQTLRARLQSSALMDAPRFARDFEAACRRAWREWCERAP